MPEVPDPEALRPEEYLELYCYDQVCLFFSRFALWKYGKYMMLILM